MSFLRSSRAVPAAALLLVAGHAAAISIDYQPLPDQSSAVLVQSSGGTTVTAHAFGGVPNPQATMTPTGTPGGFTALNVNVGGSALLGTRGLGCGAVASQCDLIAPVGEDVLRLTFSLPSRLDSVTLAAMEDADDVRWFYWNGASYQLAGSDTCAAFSFCAGNETFGGPFGSHSTSWLLVAENSGATAFALRSIQFTSIPEPGTGLLVAAGLLATGAIRRRRGSHPPARRARAGARAAGYPSGTPWSSITS